MGRRGARSPLGVFFGASSWSPEHEASSLQAIFLLPTKTQPHCFRRFAAAARLGIPEPEDSHGPHQPAPARTGFASTGPCFCKLEGGWTVQQVPGHRRQPLTGHGGLSGGHKGDREPRVDLKYLDISFSQTPPDGLGFHGLRTELGFLEDELCELARGRRARSFPGRSQGRTRDSAVGRLS